MFWCRVSGSTYLSMRAMVVSSYLSMRAMVVRRATTAQRVTSPHEVDGKAGQCNRMFNPCRRSAT